MFDWQEVVLIFTILLLVFGPTKLPKIAKELGKMMREFNKAASGLKEEVDKASSDLTKDVKPSSPSAFKSQAKTTNSRNKDKTVSDIAKKLNITPEGKTNKQIIQEIITKIDGKKGKSIESTLNETSRLPKRNNEHNS
jgi:sec-independent protein translocase protein TatA